MSSLNEEIIVKHLFVSVGFYKVEAHHGLSVMKLQITHLTKYQTFYGELRIQMRRILTELLLQFNI